MTALPPFVLTRTANMRHLPAAALQVPNSVKWPQPYQVMCNVSLLGYDPRVEPRPSDWVRRPSMVAHPERLPECPRCRRRLVEREAGRSAGKRSTVAWGAESRSERRPNPTHQKTQSRPSETGYRPRNEAHSMTAPTHATPSLRVWHIPQIPMKAFYVPVASLTEARKIVDVLADYDLFQFENRVKPDYANASGAAYLDEDGDWCDIDLDDEEECAYLTGLGVQP